MFYVLKSLKSARKGIQFLAKLQALGLQLYWK